MSRSPIQNAGLVMAETPEDKARKNIDKQLEACGWTAQDRKATNITASRGVAIREFPLVGGEEADYLLYAGGKAIGVVEAKPEGHTLTGVEIQSDKYTKGLQEKLPAYRRPLPFAYQSTGVETRFTNGLDPDFRSREVFTFHRPETLIKWATQETQLRERLRSLPPLIDDGLSVAGVDDVLMTVGRYGWDGQRRDREGRGATVGSEGARWPSRSGADTTVTPGLFFSPDSGRMAGTRVSRHSDKRRC